MTHRYRLFRRGSGIFFLEDRTTGQQESLRTKIRDEAVRLFHARNEANRQPALNLQIARAYLMAVDPAIATRTWQHAMDEIVKSKHDVTQVRWTRAINQHAFDSIRNLPILETRAEQFFAVLQSGTVSTNVYLRRIHNFALDMNWLPWSLIPKKQWPAVRFQEKRAVTLDEHRRIIAREPNAERRAFYELCWHLGGSQSDIACLDAKDVDWPNRTVSYSRKKTDVRALIHIDEDVGKILEALPKTGPLFPYLCTVRAGDRATEFKQRCVGLGITGVSLHSYRYAWAERARVAGMPERFAQEALGHNSKAIHRAYARKAQVKVPSLGDYEKAMDDRKVVGVVFQPESKIPIASPGTNLG